MRVDGGYIWKVHTNLLHVLVIVTPRRNNPEVHVQGKADLALNPLKPKLVQILFKNSVRTAKKTQHFTITKINWLTLFKDCCLQWESYETHKYKTKSNWLLRDIQLPLGFKGIIKHHAMKSCRRMGGRPKFPILNFGNRRKWVIRDTTQPLQPLSLTG
jgi:hypothetical protein